MNFLRDTRYKKRCQVTTKHSMFQLSEMSHSRELTEEQPETDGGSQGHMEMRKTSYRVRDQ